MRTLAMLTVALAGCVVDGERTSTPVQLQSGAPLPFGFVLASASATSPKTPTVGHDVCVAVDTDTGFVVPTALTDAGGFLGPAAGAAVETSPISGLDCPTGDPWRGWARLEWDTVTGRGLATVEHSLQRSGGSGSDVGGGASGFVRLLAGGSGPVPSGGELLFVGEVFPGFALDPAPVLADPVGDAQQLTLHVKYAATASLPQQPAAFIDVAPSSAPTGLTVLGGSPGYDSQTGKVRTDAQGDAYLVIDHATTCMDGHDRIVYVTTPDGGIKEVATISCVP